MVIDLTGTEEDFFARYPSGQRTKLRKAQAAGLVTAQAPASEVLDTFRSIYRRTMTHLEAKPFYFFNDAYFEHLAASLGARDADLRRCSDANRPVAAALFLVCGETMHYHLGGSDEMRRESRPNNLLFHEAAVWGRAHGCRWLHLGGGRTSDGGDALLGFKRTLSDKRLRFELGRRVHDTAAYELLCAQWLKRMGRTERPNYFLLYRLEEVLRGHRKDDGPRWVTPRCTKVPSPGKADRFTRKIRRGTSSPRCCSSSRSSWKSWQVWREPELLERVGDLLTIAALVLLMYRYRDYAIVEPLPAGLGLTRSVDFYRQQLARQRDLAGNPWRFLALFIPGVALSLFGDALARPPAQTAGIAAFGVALFLAVAWLNRRTARKMQDEIDELS